jgi:hypothetical protein
MVVVGANEASGASAVGTAHDRRCDSLFLENDVAFRNTAARHEGEEGDDAEGDESGDGETLRGDSCAHGDCCLL